MLVLQAPTAKVLATWWLEALLLHTLVGQHPLLGGVDRKFSPANLARGLADLNQSGAGSGRCKSIYHNLASHRRCRAGKFSVDTAFVSSTVSCSRT